MTLLPNEYFRYIFGVGCVKLLDPLAKELNLALVFETSGGVVQVEVGIKWYLCQNNILCVYFSIGCVKLCAMWTHCWKTNVQNGHCSDLNVSYRCQNVGLYILKLNLLRASITLVQMYKNFYKTEKSNILTPKLHVNKPNSVPNMYIVSILNSFIKSNFHLKCTQIYWVKFTKKNETISCLMTHKWTQLFPK